MDKEQNKRKQLPDSDYEGRKKYFMDIDRMQNEGLAGGYVDYKSAGMIDQTSTDEMKRED